MFILYVSHQQRARDFYASVLARDPDLDVPGMTEFALPDGGRLGLTPNDGIARVLGDAVPHPAQGAGIPRCELYLQVDDPAASLARALQSGATPVSDVAERPWGERAGYCADPDGHVLAFAAAMPATKKKRTPGLEAGATPAFRAATIDDLDAVVQFMREYYTFDHLRFDEAIARRAARAMIDDARLGIIWLIEHDGAPAGYAVFAFIHGLEFGGACAWLDELYLREAFRGKGLARVTVEFLLEECRRRNICALRLEVEHSNTRAAAVYERLGFERHERSAMTKMVE